MSDIFLSVKNALYNKEVCIYDTLKKDVQRRFLNIMCKFNKW
jgi:hypothetical protein